jgi:hypothetical protein
MNYLRIETDRKKFVRKTSLKEEENIVTGAQKGIGAVRDGLLIVQGIRTTITAWKGWG